MENRHIARDIVSEKNSQSETNSLCFNFTHPGRSSTTLHLMAGRMPKDTMSTIIPTLALSILGQAAYCGERKVGHRKSP
jgi:hypothetical protein